MRLVDSKIGFAAFQKKAEFGPGSLVLEQLALDGVEVPFLVEEGSQASVDGRPMRSDQRRVKAMLYDQD